MRGDKLDLDPTLGSRIARRRTPKLLEQALVLLLGAVVGLVLAVAYETGADRRDQWCADHADTPQACGTETPTW